MSDEYKKGYKHGYADAMNWKTQNHLEHLPAAQQSNEQVEQRLELIGHADLAINNIYIFSGYGEEVPEGRTPLYAGYKNTHPPVPTAMQMDVIVVNLVREGINKHRARELAEHFIKNTTPPQRTTEQPRQWVGLTPQERDEINQQVFGIVPHYVAFHHAIEAKLKEKNTWQDGDCKHCVNGCPACDARRQSNVLS